MNELTLEQSQSSVEKEQAFIPSREDLTPSPSYNKDRTNNLPTLPNVKGFEFLDIECAPKDRSFNFSKQLASDSAATVPGEGKANKLDPSKIFGLPTEQLKRDELGDLLKSPVSPLKDLLRMAELGNAPLDRTSTFKFPEDKPLDQEHAKEQAEKIAKWIKEDIKENGKISPAVQDRIKDLLNSGISHGQKGMEDMLKLLNKQLEGTGYEIKTDGKPFSHYQTCNPKERGTYHGDFISFDIMKGGDKAETLMVKVKAGDVGGR